MAASSAKHDVFQAIADPTRRRLLKLLSQQEMPVKAISDQFPISRTAVSKHLRVLADAGLVKERKVGRETRYMLEAEPLYELKDWLQYFEIFWDNKLSALRRFVESDEPDNNHLAGPTEVIKSEE
ncbi:metalloregulator ArsR/SmtB family transcription factor [Neobacillus niacini]|uniref:ArsR/SmtB family transcription factor n=1 Tax=Neobacillus niacini TaxID=86668 RepID=UPI0028543B70|nr:metalloregulator ArsR/SmtB family transcription factor [Neobacillus niacini]MDR7000501.1 DNA-binding transcriptional ArsR family regulator [Neobacillus niacini]